MKPKTKIILLLIFLNVLLVIPQSATRADFPSLKLDCYDSALNIDEAGQLIKDAPITRPTCDMSDFGQLIINVSKIILGISGSLFLLIFMYGGILWIISAGNSERVQKGKKAFSAAIIGLGFVVGAWLIVNFIIIGLTGGKINEIGKILNQGWNKATLTEPNAGTNGGGEAGLGLGCCEKIIEEIPATDSYSPTEYTAKCSDSVTEEACTGGTSDMDVLWFRDYICDLDGYCVKP